MLIASANDAEVQATIEVALALVNGSRSGQVDVRQVLADNAFSRAGQASQASIRRLRTRIEELTPLFVALPDASVEDAAAMVNEELTELPVSPSVVDHGGVGPHLHWTASTARFDDQVLADLFMAVAQELCANGTSRFGRCGAEGCDDLFYDSTRNRSRRFCDDPRCASRTHTAAHRARGG